MRGGTDLRRLRLDYLDDVPCASKLALAFIPVPVHTMIACAGQPTPRDAAWRAVATDLVYAKAYAWDPERLLANWPLYFREQPTLRKTG